MHDTSKYSTLSAREWQVTLLAVKGHANKVIAEKLQVTEGTIKLHLHNIYQKLGINGRLALVLQADQVSLAAMNDDERIGTPS